jgi:hypothetical protein
MYVVHVTLVKNETYPRLIPIQLISLSSKVPMPWFVTNLFLYLHQSISNYLSQLKNVFPILKYWIERPPILDPIYQLNYVKTKEQWREEGSFIKTYQQFVYSILVNRKIQGK